MIRMKSFDKIFEVSFEVCNKVGGIYTVISSKADILNTLYFNKYYLVGPYYESKAKYEFEENDTDFKDLLSVKNKLKEKGIILHFGKWLIKGKPKTILVEINDYSKFTDSLKYEFWEKYGIDSLNAGYDFEEPMLWSSAVGEMINEYTNQNKKKTVIGHFHEWLSGFGLLKSKSNENVKTIFTTHATILGRTLCANDVDIYNNISKIDPVAEAYNHSIQSKFLTEKACATNADTFTTVSEITSYEAKHFLGRKADVLLLNGLDLNKFPSFEEISLKHNENRQRLREFITYYFTPYYEIDIEQTLIYFIVGRYEFKNKGIDLFIKSLGKLNEKMKKENHKKNVVAFFWIPRDNQGIKEDVLRNKNKFRHFKSIIERHEEEIKSKLLLNVLTQDDLAKDLFSEDVKMDIKKARMEYDHPGNPPLSAFEIPNEYEDSIIKSFIENGLLNRKEDKVKVIDYPVYLSGNDGLIDINYYDAIIGSHLGVFASYYEPWGYTPLESAALGVPAITTDLSGYGKFLKEHNDGEKGVFVLNRFKKNEKEIVHDFVNLLEGYANLSRKERVDEKIEAKEVSEIADWKLLINNYIKAYEDAINKK